MKVTNTNFINNYYEFNHNNNYYRLYILNVPELNEKNDIPTWDELILFAKRQVQ